MGGRDSRSTTLRLLLLAGLVVASQSASLTRIQSAEFGPLPQSAVCPQTCTLVNKQIQYTPGSTYLYKVNLSTRIGDQQAPTSAEDDQTPSFENQEVVITGQAEISAYSQCELVMRLRKVQVAGFEDGRSQRLASQLQAAPIHFAYEDGIVADVCADQADDQWIIDVKKSVISALQMSSSDVAQPQTLIETDISGRCETVYEPLESNSEVTILRKTKSRSKCSDRHQVNIAFFPAAYGFNQALQNSLSSVLTPNSTSECTQVLKGQIIESVACEDRQELRYPLNGLPIISRIELQLTEKRPEIAVQRIETPFVRKHRTTSSSPFTSTASSKVNSIFSSTVAESQRRAYSIGEVAHLLKNICRKVHYSVEYDVPVLFHELITALHFLPAADQAQLWSQIHAGSICPSPKLRDIFLDAAALSGSEGSIEVLLQAYQSQHVISRARANYLFGLLAFSKAPTVAAARRLVTFIQQQQQQQNQQLVQLPRGVLFGATGFVHNLQMTAEGQQTQAHQLVQDLVHSLIQAIKVVIPQAMASQPEHQQALTLIYSLKNLVLVDQVFQPTAHQLVELLKQVVSSSSPAPHTIEISVAIVRTLVNAGIDDSVRQYLLQSILINPQDSIHHVELQIEAYRAIVLSGATQSQLETIKQWTERISSSSSSRRNGPQQQLVNYIRSHQANLRSTSDPHKQTILPAGAPVFEAPSGAWFGVSRNYEFSYVDHEIGVGASLEGDVIYEASTAQSAQQLFPVPQTVAFNYTMPIGGQELQLVEVRFHQHGLEPLIERHMRAMDRQFRSADPAKVALETLKYLLIHGTEIFAENPHIRVLLQIVVDGKTVLLADERDITSEDIAIAELDFLGQLTEQLHSSIAIDRAFAITPVDSLVRFPSVNGLPVTVRLNSSVVFGFKSEVAVDVRNADDTRISFAVYPSVAVTAETAVAFHAGSEKKVVEHVQSWSSAPQLNFEARGSRGRIVTFKVDLPQKKYTLARIESVIYSRNVATGERVRLMVPKSSSQIVGSYPTSDIHICSKATEKALGVAICYDLSYNTNLPYGRGFDLLAEITVVKTDSGLTSYEATFESPLKFSQIFSQKSQLRSAKDIIDELAPFRFHFNTPGSEVDRHIQLELELVNSHSALVKEARLRLKTPWKAVTGALVLRNEAKERVAKIELTVDGQPKWLAAEVALEVVRRGAKTEWKPRVILSMNSILERPVHLAGALSISRGRKTSIHLQLEDSIARRQYIKGTYIRERPSERNALARTSADLVVALRGLQAKSAATFEHGDRLVKIEISSDYKLPSWDQTEQAKVALKLQNHSNNSGEKKITKMTGIGLIKATQLSKYEINYSQNLHIISGESLEHDLKLDWASDSDSSSSSSSSPQVRLHQTAKKTGQRGKVDLEASSLVIYRPQQVHYEVKVTGGAVVSPLLSYHLAAVGTGKHSSQFNFKGDLAYALLSKSPLKLDMSISLKAPQVGLVYVYHDEIEEKSPGEYHGHLLLQMSPVDMYDMTYVYRLSEDESERAVEHQMDVIFLKGSMKKLAYKHHGLLRLEDGGKAISLRSRLTDEQAAKGANEIWNTQIDLAPGKKEITFSSLPKEIRAKAKYEAVYQGPSSAQWSFDSPALTHQAEYEYSGPEGQYWSFDSKTKRAGEKLMEIQSKANAKLGHRRLRLSSKYFDGECELELPSESNQQKKAKLRFDLPNSWSHESTFSQSPEQSSVMQVDSRTHYAQNSVPIYDLSARYDPSTSQSHFKLNTPLNSVEMQAEMSQAKKIALKKALLKFKRGSDYEHQSQFTFEPSTSAVDFDSFTTGKSGSPLTKLKYAYAGHRDQLHQIDLQTPEEISLIGGQWSGQWDGQRRSAKIDWANKRANLKHNTQITVDQPDQIMVSFDSTTSDYQSGSPLFQAKGALNPSDRSWISLKSHKKDQLRKMDFEAHRSKRSAKLDFDYDQYTHQSEINADDEQEQDQQWKAKCNTRKSGKTIFDLDARIGGIKGANKFDASIPNYDFSSMLDLPSQIASMDLKSRRSGRHLLGSVGVNQQADADRSFHFDFAWDIDRDPASKVALDLLIKRVPIESRSRSAGQQLMIEASAAYAESKLIFNSQFVPKSGGFSSPHPIRLSLSFIPSSSSSSSSTQRDSWQLIYLHQMEQPNSFTCKWEWIVGGRPQYGLQLNGKLENESFGNSAKKIIFSAKTSAPASKPRLALTFNLVAGVRAPGNAYFFDSSLVHGNDQTSQKKYQATFDLTKHLETRKVDGKLEIRLPALKVHVAAFSLDLTERRFSLELINEQSGKMVDIEASYGHHLVHLKVASQGAQSLLVPKVDALVRYVPGEELHARLSLDEERKFELTAKYSGELSKLQFYVLTKVDSVYTPSVEFIAEGRKPSEESGSAQRSVAITGKWNMVEVVKAGFNQAAVRQWTAQGFVASVGSGDKLVEASVVSTPTEEHFTTYQVKVQPKEGNAYGMKAFGAKIEERRPTAANEYIRSVKVDIYQQQQEQQEKRIQILSTEVSLKHAKWAQIPEMVEVSLRHVPSASHGSLRVAIREKVSAEDSDSQNSLFSTVPETASVSGQKRSSVLRDQMLLGWNTKSVGFALITSQWTSPSQATEHALKIYTPSGRVVEHRCAHLWSEQLVFFKQALKADYQKAESQSQEQPLYQTTVIVQRNQNQADQGYNGKLLVESFKFARSPKAVHFEVQPASQERPLDAKLRIDIGASEKEALTLKVIVENKPAAVSAGNRYFGLASVLNQTVHFEAKSEKSVDFSVDGHVSQSSVGMLWKNVNRKGKLQQGHYLLQFIGDDRFEAVLSNPTTQYLINGIYKRKQIQNQESPLVMDLTVQKSVSKHSNSYSSSAKSNQLVSEHKVHIESAGRCIRAEIEDVQKLTSSRQINLCADLQRANILNLAVDSIGANGQKTAEFSARLDAKSAAKSLALGASWNPVYSRRLLQTLLNIKEASGSESDLVNQISHHELVQELSAKYDSLFRSVLANAAQPLAEVAKELAPIAAEYGITEAVLQRWASTLWTPVSNSFSSISQTAQENLDQLTSAYEETVEEVKKACARSSGCRSISEALAKGNDEIARLASKSMVNLLKKTHRFVVRSKGALLEKMNAEQWAEQLTDLVPETVSETLKSSIESAYSWTRSTVLNPSGPFSGVIRHLETIFGELMGSGDQSSIKWQRIESSISEAVHLLASPSAWASSVRVLLWDPTNGQLMVEVKSPQTAFTSAFGGLDSSDNSNSSASSYSWLNGINSYDRAAQPTKAASSRFY